MFLTYLVVQSPFSFARKTPEILFVKWQPQISSMVVILPIECKFQTKTGKSGRISYYGHQMSVVALKNISLQIFDIFIRYYYRTIYYLTDALSNRVIFSANYIYQNISQYQLYILRNNNTFSQFPNLSVATYWVLIIFNYLIHSFSPLDCFSKASTLLLLASMGFQSPYPFIFFLYGEQ